MAGVQNKIITFVLLTFLLLGVLFGMQIMTFIFGNLGTSNINSLDNPTATVLLETAGYINETGYTVDEASNSLFLGSVSITDAQNTTSGQQILAGNYTVDATTGVITNATTTVWEAVTFNYTYAYKSDIRLATEETTNNSLQGVVTYTNQSSTQLNTVAIAVTLLILIALFLIFWVAFIKPMMGNSKNKSGGQFS